jgi:hypothetical protein
MTVNRGKRGGGDNGVRHQPSRRLEPDAEAKLVKMIEAYGVYATRERLGIGVTTLYRVRCGGVATHAACVRLEEKLRLVELRNAC